METIHVALIFDDNYVEHSIVLMTSVLYNKADDEKIHFHILDSGLSNKSKTQIFELKNCEITFHLIKNKVFDDHKKKKNNPVSTLWTTILPEIIKLDRLIYLNTESVVNSSLKELWQTELGDNFIAAVEDSRGKKYSKRLRLNPWSKFFSPGVMVLNCVKCREENISKKAQGVFIRSNKSEPEDIILNRLFEGKVKFVDLKWNLQYCPIWVFDVCYNPDDYIQAIKSPAIVNYVGDFKPWKKGLGCLNPKQQDYLKYRQMTSYAFKNHKRWELLDKLTSFRGILIFAKQHPFFWANKNFWNILIKRSYS